MKRSILHLAIIAAIVAGVIGTSGAFFSDTEESKDNVFTAGRLDLKINGQDNPSNIVNFNDLKPGDNYTQNKTLYIDFNPAKVWMHLKDLTDGQGEQTEPEMVEENGTPKSDIQNYLDYALVVGDQTIIATDSAVKLPEFVSCWIPLGLIPGATDVVMQQIFHFDPTVTNWAQGDMLTFTEEFYAQQVNDPSIPDTGTGRVWDPTLGRCVTVTPSPLPTAIPTPIPSVTPTPITCIPQWVSEVTVNNQGTRKDGTAILSDRSNTAYILGAAQSTGTPYDTVVPNSFFSLGFTNGNVTVKFVDVIPDRPGYDFRIYEITGGTSYPDEKVRVEASPDGSSWTELAASMNRDGYVDMSPLTSVQYLRLTDVSVVASFESTADGYDLDAVQAICGSTNGI
jgi:predicted ribosomally synthesized peptide with SipW-like signal peptide